VTATIDDGQSLDGEGLGRARLARSDRQTGYALEGALSKAPSLTLVRPDYP